MKKILPFFILFLMFLLTPAHPASAAELSMKIWPGHEYYLANEEVARDHLLNFLTFPGARCVHTGGVSPHEWLTDGDIGTHGDRGRVVIGGRPTRMVYYLGEVKNIHQIKIWTGNIDSRGNQDWEIRLANNGGKPGEEPQFPRDATFTSGDKILDAQGGALCSTISNPDGSYLGEADWVEFRLWQTAGTKGGDPAKDKSPTDSWGAALELQVLGNVADPKLFTSEAKRQEWWKRKATVEFSKKLLTLGPDVDYAMKNREAVKRMIESLGSEFPDKYDAAKYMAKWEEFDRAFLTFDKTDIMDEAGMEKLLALVKKYNVFRREATLANPYLDFEKLLVRRSGDPAFTVNWVSAVDRGRKPYGDRLVTVRMKDLIAASADSRGHDAPQEEIFRGPNDSLLADICLHWDATRMMVTALNPEQHRWQVYELNTDGTNFHQVSPDMGRDIDNAEGCYLPDGAMIFNSSASMMGIPCIFGDSLVGNLFRVEADGKTVRQLTFEQDQDWFPTVLPNGRVMYLRWEYTDMMHYFSRILFTMNPDGTKQLALYGSNSYWPNSLFYAKHVPGHPTKITGVVTGHHGVQREGELHIFDPTLGDHEADGVVQQIPGYGKKVEPRIADQLVNESWPKFVCPTPLSENYILVNCKMDPAASWGLYLVDTYDNITLLYEDEKHALWEPTPLIERPVPPVIAPQFEDGNKEASMFITDIYFGPGLANVPRGAVKKIRIHAYQYGYRGIASHDYLGMESSWDVKKVIGEVPVYEDGSAFFKIPANTPIALQPLDENGAAMQLMRSWTVGMPGERVSCIGCHESQNSVTPTKIVQAFRSEISEITPFYGPQRAYGFVREIQPILDKYCVGCHDGADRDLPNFAATEPSHRGFSTSYHHLSRFVRRPGPESDMHLFNPMEYHATTSELVQILNKGHQNVKLDEESRQKLYCWIDYNVPYHASWLDVAKAQNRPDHVMRMADRTQEIRKLYANLDEHPEIDYEFDAPEKPEWIRPERMPEIDRSAPKLANFPFTVPEDYARQKENRRVVELSEKVRFEMVKIPAGECVMGDEMGEIDEFPRKAVKIEKPFWMMETEVSNELYALYDPDHDSRYIDMWNKDLDKPGHTANAPRQPVIRINWHEAQGFCGWLSEKTGRKFRIPTEAEWEYAARAGTDTPFFFGGMDSREFPKYANMADRRIHHFGGADPHERNIDDWRAFIPHAEEFDDGNMIQADVDRYEPNPFGLKNMLGNVWEWTATSYKDGTQLKTVKGGSWMDRPKRCRAGMKLPYEAWQKMDNVGFRVICEE